MGLVYQSPLKSIVYIDFWKKNIRHTTGCYDEPPKQDVKTPVTADKPWLGL